LEPGKWGHSLFLEENQEWSSFLLPLRQRQQRVHRRRDRCARLLQRVAQVTQRVLDQEQLDEAIEVGA
jgi:hypothetical protein